MKTKWETIGQVCVDTGTLVICDPCLLRDVLWPNERKSPDEQHQLNILLAGGKKLAAAAQTSTGLGDGFFDVEARKIDGMVAEIRIKFL